MRNRKTATSFVLLLLILSLLASCMNAGSPSGAQATESASESEPAQTEEKSDQHTTESASESEPEQTEEKSDQQIIIEAPSEALIRQIDADYAAYLMELYHYDPEIDGPFRVMYYYGSYGDCIPFIGSGMDVTHAYWDDEVADSVIHYSNGAEIEVWRSGEFFSLKEAYEQELLTREQIALIAQIHNGWYYLRMW